MKLLYSGFRDSRHSKFGGYDWIRFYPKADYISDKNVPLGFLNIGQRGKTLNLRFLDKTTRQKSENYDLVHYFYGDLGLYSPLPKNRKCKAVATIHCNTDKLEKHHNNIIECIKSLDAVIVLNSNQAEYLREKYSLNAVFIPHGFNKPEFSFIESKNIVENFDSAKINIAVIGRQYRDYETLHFAIKNVPSNIHFYLIGLKEFQKTDFIAYKNVTVCPRLDDDSYYSLISQCDYSFLPLIFATANNALMESQYLGIRCVLPKISGVLDYAAESENFYYENRNELLSILSSLNKTEPSEYLKIYATKYSWNNVYQQLKVLYETVCGESK